MGGANGGKGLFSHETLNGCELDEHGNTKVETVEGIVDGHVLGGEV